MPRLDANFESLKDRIAVDDGTYFAHCDGVPDIHRKKYPDGGPDYVAIQPKSVIDEGELAGHEFWPDMITVSGIARKPGAYQGQPLGVRDLCRFLDATKAPKTCGRCGATYTDKFIVGNKENGLPGGLYHCPMCKQQISQVGFATEDFAGARYKVVVKKVKQTLQDGTTTDKDVNDIIDYLPID